MSKAVAAGVILVTGSLASGVAMAQTADAPTSAEVMPPESADDIVVTARRGEESLLKVPVQVNVLSAADLLRTRADDLAKLSEAVPFATITRSGTGGGGIFIVRGVGNAGADVGLSQSVLLNIDNVFIGRGRVSTMSMFDLRQVEVLKGPQALYYGQNSPAGVITVTSADPENSFSVSARTGYEFVANQFYAEAAVSVPLGDTLAVRFAGRYDHMRGYMRNTAVARPQVFPALAGLVAPGASDRFGPQDTNAVGRITAVWTPTPEFKAKVKYSYGRSTSNAINGVDELYCVGQTRPHSLGAVDDQQDCIANRSKAVSDPIPELIAGMANIRDGMPFLDTRAHLASLALNYDFGPVSLSSVTGYYHLNYSGLGNLYVDSFAPGANSSGEVSSAISEELRLSTQFSGPLNFVVGAFYSKEKLDTLQDALVPTVYTPDPRNGYRFQSSRVFNYDTETKSLLGQASWNIFEELNLSAGARYSHVVKSGFDGNVFVNANAVNFLPEGQFFVRSLKESNVSPEVTLTWYRSDDQTLYLSYKSGYRPGGFSGPSLLRANFTDANTRFRQEKNRGVEIGYKARLFDRKLDLQLAAYRYRYSNQQVTSYDAAAISFLVANAGSSRQQGFEASATYRVTPEFRLTAAAGYNDTHYLEFVGAACFNGQTVAQGCVGGAQDLSGRTAPRSPKVSGNIGGVYTAELSSGLSLTVNGDAVYTSGYNPIDSLDPRTQVNGFWKFNAGLSLEGSDHAWRLSLLGRNLSNQYRPIVTRDKPAGLSGEYVAAFNRPREVAIEVGVKF